MPWIITLPVGTKYTCGTHHLQDGQLHMMYVYDHNTGAFQEQRSISVSRGFTAESTPFGPAAYLLQKPDRRCDHNNSWSRVDHETICDHCENVVVEHTPVGDVWTKGAQP